MCISLLTCRRRTEIDRGLSGELITRGRYFTDLLSRLRYVAPPFVTLEIAGLVILASSRFTTSHDKCPMHTARERANLFVLHLTCCLGLFSTPKHKERYNFYPPRLLMSDVDETGENCCIFS